MLTAKFEGTITTVQPFFQVLPNAEKERTNKMTVMFEGSPYEVAIISPNTLRAILRRGVAMDILEKLGDGSFDYRTLAFLVMGGNLDKKLDKKKEKDTTKIVKDKLEAISFMQKNNVVASLFGGAVGGNIMIPGKVSVSPAILICKETNDITHEQSDSFASTFLAKGFSFVCYDSMQHDINVFNKLNKTGVEELQQRVESHTKQSANRKAKKNGEQEDSPNTDDKQDISKGKTQSNLLGCIEYVVPGAVFYHKIEILNPTDIEVGAIYSALKRFTFNPKIGSYKMKMGEVSMQYALYYGSDNIDNITVNEYSNRTCKYNDERFLNKYNEYIDQLTMKHLTIPEVLVK